MIVIFASRFRNALKAIFLCLWNWKIFFCQKTVRKLVKNANIIYERFESSGKRRK